MKKRVLSLFALVLMVLFCCRKNEQSRLQTSNIKNGTKSYLSKIKVPGSLMSVGKSTRARTSSTTSSSYSCTGIIYFEGEFTSTNTGYFVEAFYENLDLYLHQHYSGEFSVAGGMIGYSNSDGDLSYGYNAESLIRSVFSLTASQNPTYEAAWLYLNVSTSGGCGLGGYTPFPGTGAGGTGTPSSDIIDSLTDVCFKKALTKGISSNFTNTIDTIIKKLNSNAKVYVKVVQKDHVYDQSNNEVDGITTNYDYNTQNYNFMCTIQINASVMGGATQEYTLSTMIHEVLHAYIRFDGGKNIDPAQTHEQIANKYVKPFAELLNSIYPNLTMRDATALAWGGLKTTALWKSSFESDAFTIGTTGQTMTFTELQGLLNAHHFGFTSNGSDKCAN